MKKYLAILLIITGCSSNLSEQIVEMVKAADEKPGKAVCFVISISHTSTGVYCIYKEVFQK